LLLLVQTLDHPIVCSMKIIEINLYAELFNFTYHFINPLKIIVVIVNFRNKKIFKKKLTIFEKKKTNNHFIYKSTLSNYFHILKQSKDYSCSYMSDDRMFTADLLLPLVRSMTKRMGYLQGYFDAKLVEITTKV